MQQNQGMSGDKGRSTGRDQEGMRSVGGGNAPSQQGGRATSTTGGQSGMAPGRASESRGQGKVQGKKAGQQVGQENAKTVQPYIKNVNYPANKDEVLRGARDSNAPAEIVDLIALIDDDIDYDSDADVVVTISQCTF